MVGIDRDEDTVPLGDGRGCPGLVANNTQFSERHASHQRLDHPAGVEREVEVLVIPFHDLVLTLDYGALGPEHDLQHLYLVLDQLTEDVDEGGALGSHLGFLEGGRGGGGSLLFDPGGLAHSGPGLLVLFQPEIHLSTDDDEEVV